MPRKKTEHKHSDTPSNSIRISMGMLLFALALAALNLNLMTSRVGTLTGLEKSWSEMLSEYKQRTFPKVFTPEPDDAKTVVLVDDVSGKVDSDPMWRTHLIDPLVDYYLLAGPHLKVMLIERKNARSKDVSVRLFFDDKKFDQTFLWPSKQSKDGWWLPPCGTEEDVTANRAQTACPKEWVEKYPEINIDRSGS